MGFFDSIDTNEALAHETTMHHLSCEAGDQLRMPSWRNLDFRKHVGDPFDLMNRPVIGAIGTLTIRAAKTPTIVLHHRNGSNVAGGGGMTHLLPAGIFQPSSVLPEALDSDFSIWRNIQREYAEEILGYDEYDGSGRPIDYARDEFFKETDEALLDGRIRVWCLGAVLDALTLCGEFITVATIEPALYDKLFAEAVTINTEGTVSAHNTTLDRHTLHALRASTKLSPGAAAALHLAWRHRDTLLERTAQSD